MEQDATQAADSFEIPHQAQTLVKDEDLLTRDTQIVIEKMTSVLGPLLAIVVFVGALSRPASLSRSIGDVVAGLMPAAAAPNRGHAHSLHQQFAATRRARLPTDTRFSDWEDKGAT